MGLKPLLIANHLRKEFLYPARVEVLRDVSLQLFASQSIAIMGSSGEGKSTLLQILGTLEAPTSGELRICGHPASAQRAALLRNRHIGFVFQAFNLLEDYTVLQNVLMPALIAGKEIGKKTASYARACALLERVGLTKRQDFPAKLLSGGEKQRVALARALCNNPEIILADEPSGNLDPISGRQMRKLFFELVKEYGKAVIIVTHDPKLAACCDTRLVLSEGYLHEQTLS